MNIMNKILQKKGIQMFLRGNTKKAIDIFEKLPEKYKIEILLYLGLAYYMNGNYYFAYEYLKQCSELDKIESENANNWIRHLDLSACESIDVLSLDKINIHFMEHFEKREKYIFISKNLLAYKYLSSCINTDFQKKIDIFVYQENIDNIGNRLSFANPPLLTIHTQIGHTKGHELAHLFVNNIFGGVKSKARFVDEGFAGFLNEKKVYNEMKVVEILGKKCINVYDYWENFEKDSVSFSYCVAECFIGFFVYKIGIKDANLLMKYQRYHDAKKIYGAVLENIILEFEYLTK